MGSFLSRGWLVAYAVAVAAGIGLALWLAPHTISVPTGPAATGEPFPAPPALALKPAENPRSTGSARPCRS